jgi:hypothetical protein
MIYTFIIFLITFNVKLGNFDNIFNKDKHLTQTVIKLYKNNEQSSK